MLTTEADVLPLEELIERAARGLCLHGRRRRHVSR